MVIDFEKDKQGVECKKCGSKFTYVRIKDKTRVCRSCGHIEKIGEEKEDGN